MPPSNVPGSVAAEEVGWRQEAAESRAVLVRPSGRQTKHGESFTGPALPAGLHVPPAILDLPEHHDIEDHRRVARQALPFRDPGWPV